MCSSDLSVAPPLPPSTQPKRLLSLRDLGGHRLPDVRLRLTLDKQLGKSWLTVTGPDGLALVPGEIPEDEDGILLFEHEPQQHPGTGIAALPMRLHPTACTARELGSESPFELTAERALGILAIKVLQPAGEPLPEAELLLWLGDTDRKSGVEGKSGDPGGRRILKKKKTRRE